MPALSRTTRVLTGFAAVGLSAVLVVELLPAGAIAPAPRTRTELIATTEGAEIEGYARYEPQSTSSPSARPGTLVVRDMLRTRDPQTRNLGIGRACSSGGRSEHKEGRAFDWGEDVADASERVAVEDFLGQLLATDEEGNALARRMGVMYMIWDRRIWSSYRADGGWRPYSGESQHSDHIHLSQSWAGGMAETSF